MAAPNLLTSTNVEGKTALAILSTVTSNVITNGSSSNSVAKLNSIVLSNSSASVVYANVVINRSATAYFLSGNVSIPANSTLVLLGKDTSLYLEEGDVMQANVSANSSISISASYELIV